MTEEIDARRARLTAALEKQFDGCDAAATKLLAQMAVGDPDYYNMPIAIALLRLSGQTADAIARLDERAERAAGKSPNRGSITK